MISKCQTVTVAKKKFSDFEYVNSVEDVYLVGYTTDVDEAGKEYTYNIRINAADIVKRAEPVILKNLNPCGGEGYDTISIGNTRVFVFDIENCGTYIQINDLSYALDQDGFFHFALSKTTAPGTRVDIVITAPLIQENPFNGYKGIALHSSCAESSDEGDINKFDLSNISSGKAPVYISLVELAPVRENMPSYTMCTNIALNVPVSEFNGGEEEPKEEITETIPGYYGENSNS